MKSRIMLVTITGSFLIGLTAVHADVVAPTLSDTYYGSAYLKNRYLTIDPLAAGENAGKTFGIRVTLSASETRELENAVGTTWWVGAPDVNCISLLVDNVEVRTWDSCPELHITGCGVVPASTYQLVTVDTDGESPTFLEWSTVNRPAEKWWGDLIGSFDPGVPAWTPPQGVTSADDVVAVVRTFQGPTAVNAVPIPVGDQHPRVPNRSVNFDDVYANLLAFQGLEYHFGCPQDPCLDELAGPCP